MRRSYKFRLYPTNTQSRDLEIMLDSHRHLYNRCLEIRSNAYKLYKISVSYADCSSWFKTERKYNNWFASLNFSSSQDTMRRLDGTFKRFFQKNKSGKRSGYPRFKPKDRFNSFSYPTHGDGIRLKDNKVRVSNVGVIRVKNHRDIIGEINTLSIKHEADKWFLVLSCETPDVVIPKSTNPPVGIDMGLESFLITSNGEHIDNPRFHKFALPEIRRASRKLSRAKKGSNKRKKSKKKLRKVHSKVANKRKDFIHKLSRSIVDRYGLIAMESLSTSNMLKNHRLARSISDASWRAFSDAVQYKAEEAGVEFVKVDPRYTSQVCSGCGQIVKKDLSVRWHDCSCGLSIHRDVNAARNILALARTEPKNGTKKHNLVLQHGKKSGSLPPRGRSGSRRL